MTQPPLKPGDKVRICIDGRTATGPIRVNQPACLTFDNFPVVLVKAGKPAVNIYAKTLFWPRSWVRCRPATA